MFRSKVNSQGAWWQKSLFIYFNKKKSFKKLEFNEKKYRFKKTHKEIRKNEMKERKEGRYPLIDKI